MRKVMCLIVLTALASFAFSPETAMADSIKGRLGVTGRIGFIVPSDNDAEFFSNSTDVGIIGGGGLIYGIDNHIAAEFEVTRAAFGSETGDFGVTDIAMGGQYRFVEPRTPLVPYLGAGLDILVSDYDPNDGSYRDVDTTVGVGLKGGVDYFIQRQVALTAEAKGVIAPDADIHDRSGARRGSFDPTSFTGTFGVRVFFR